MISLKFSTILYGVPHFRRHLIQLSPLVSRLASRRPWRMRSVTVTLGIAPVSVVQNVSRRAPDPSIGIKARRNLSVLNGTAPVVSSRVEIHDHHPSLFIFAMYRTSPQSFASERGQHKCCFVDLLAVVFAQLLFLLLRPGSYWLFNVAFSILATDHKADLP